MRDQRQQKRVPRERLFFVKILAFIDIGKIRVRAHAFRLVTAIKSVFVDACFS